MPTEDINAMGEMNNTWGVCGFSSALYALYEHNPSLRAKLTSGAKIDTRFAAEIKTFLRMLEAEGDAKMRADIEQFTRSFGPKWTGFTIAGYLQTIDDEAERLGTIQGNITKNLSIALPPHALVAYLQKVAGFPGAKVLRDPLGGMFITRSTAHEQIVGLRDGIKTMYNGLAHWVYMKNGVVYSWAKQFVGLQSLLTPRTNYVGVACIIELV